MKERLFAVSDMALVGTNLRMVGITRANGHSTECKVMESFSMHLEKLPMRGCGHKITYMAMVSCTMKILVSLHLSIIKTFRSLITTGLPSKVFRKSI
jgi:hypothetical protein